MCEIKNINDAEAKESQASFDFPSYKIEDMPNFLKGFKVNLKEFGSNFEVELLKPKEVKDDELLKLFEIKSKNASIFKKITSQESLKSVKKELKEKFEVFEGKFFDFTEANKLELSSLERYVQVSSSDLQRLNKHFKAEEYNSAKDLQKAYEDKAIKEVLGKFIKNFSSALIFSIKDKKKSAYYLEIIKLFNDFLQELGIYTRSLQIGKKMTDEDSHYFYPHGSQELGTKEQKDEVKELLSLAYCLDNRCVNEGEFIVWRIS